MAGSRYSIGAVRNTEGKIERYGRHKRNGKFVRWSSPYGKLLRTRGQLEATVTREQRDEFRTWARARSIVPRSARVNIEKPLRLRALAEARSLKGIVERGGNNRGPEVDRIIKDNGGVPGEPWCGDFAAWAYRRAGSKAVTRAWAGTRFLGRIAGLTSHGAREGRKGDLAVFNFPGGHPDSDHVGFVVDYTDADGRSRDPDKASHIRTLDGNVGIDDASGDSKDGGDGVGYKTRPVEWVDRTVRVRR